MKIKDLPSFTSLTNIKFKHPDTGETCYWYSQWGYPDGEAGVWYKTDPTSSQVSPIFLHDLKEALEFDLVEDSIK